MKSLNEYIKESILDDEDEIMDQMGIEFKIKLFLDENYLIKDGYEIDINNKIVNTIKGEGDILLKSCSKITKLTEGFKFGKVKYFDCSGSNIESLEGAPEEVNYFDCSNCKKLKTLKGSPKQVKNIFNCSECDSLINLEGSPKKITSIWGRYSCASCKGLKSLKGCTQKIPGVFDCSECPELTSLKDGPKSVGSLELDNCEKLIDILDKPKVKNSISMSNTPVYTEYIKNGRKFK